MLKHDQYIQYNACDVRKHNYLPICIEVNKDYFVAAWNTIIATITQAEADIEADDFNVLFEGLVTWIPIGIT